MPRIKKILDAPLEEGEIVVCCHSKNGTCIVTECMHYAPHPYDFSCKEPTCLDVPGFVKCVRV